MTQRNSDPLEHLRREGIIPPLRSEPAPESDSDSGLPRIASNGKNDTAAPDRTDRKEAQPEFSPRYMGNPDIDRVMDHDPEPMREIVIDDLDAIRAEPDPREIVEGLACEGGISNLVGDSNVGKGFVCLDLSFAIGNGEPWLYLISTKHRSVLYVAFELEALRVRIEALEKNHGKRMANFYRFRAQEPINADRDGFLNTSKRGETELRRAITLTKEKIAKTGSPPLGLVIVDTYRASLRGDESSSDVAQDYTNVLRKIMKAHPEIGFLVTHHVGWDDKGRERGSSALRGAVEYTLILKALPDEGELGKGVLLRLSGLKARDSVVLDGVYIYRQRIELEGVNNWGKPRSSCAIVPDPRTAAERASQREDEIKAAERARLTRLLSAIKSGTVTRKESLGALISTETDKMGEKRGIELLDRAMLDGLIAKPSKMQPFELTEAGVELLKTHQGVSLIPREDGDGGDE